jgi:AraC-like DNA-binding protein
MGALLNFATAEMEAARQHMAEVFRPHGLIPLGRDGRLAMRHRRLSLAPVSVHWLGYGAEITMSAPEMDRFYLFQVTLNGHCRVRRGADDLMVGPGLGYVVDPTTPLRKSWSADCRQFMVRVERDVLLRHLQRDLGTDLRRPLEFTRQPIVVPQRLNALAAYLESLAGTMADRVPARELGQVGHLLLTQLLDVFPHNYSDDYARTVSGPLPVHVRRAEAHIREHLTEPLVLADIVAAAGVSSRCLYDGFRRFRDTTPMDFVRALRLERAYRDLAEGEPGTTSVTQVALAAGFTHVSKFTRHFRERFGELPSAVLRR